MLFFHILEVGDFFVNTGVNVPVSILVKTGYELARPVRFSKRTKALVYGKEVSIASHMGVQIIDKRSITG